MTAEYRPTTAGPEPLACTHRRRDTSGNLRLGRGIINTAKLVDQVAQVCVLIHKDHIEVLPYDIVNVDATYHSVMPNGVTLRSALMTPHFGTTIDWRVECWNRRVVLRPSPH